MEQIENPMVMRRGYGIPDPQEQEPIEVAVCAGCGDSIYEHDDYVGEDPELIVHNDWECTYLAYKTKILGL